ncbi:Thiol:disulfide interchange protein TlpA [Roseovarius albus]|uniref:Thiol:disulfide interchange protein TlpA n=1 Tax=Roseovarius albus TaxID=1247867 RepID=A0A1X6Z7B8_9RHOB|nr:TlpA disulfide reductase family protein [Roseovarius albus]SLN40966.1 Thiol:disulfide interchange protein TlpA [Roseovarius albus]
MRKFRSIVLYMALALGANTAFAADPAEITALREGDMKKLIVYEEPRPASSALYVNEDGSEGSLADYKGKVVVLNLWATWCAPCRKEMPSLSELQAALSEEGIEVVTVATGPVATPPPMIAKFFTDIGVDNLPQHRDPKQDLARSVKIFGLPVSIIIDRDGNEVARMLGDADWSSDNAKAIMRAFAENPPS